MGNSHIKIIKLANLFAKIASYYEDILFEALQEFLGDDIPKSDLDKWFIKNKPLNAVINYNWHYNDELCRLCAGISKRYFKVSDIKEPDHIKMNAPAISLAPEGVIPQLWLLSGELINVNNYEASFDKLLADNAFIVNAINFVTHDQNELSLLSEFIIKNLDKINKIKSLFSGQPTILGRGTDGIAFSINEYAVLKIFTDNFSFSETKKSYDRLHLNPEIAKTESMIYDVGLLGVFDKNPIYYSIIEKMKVVDKLEINSDLETLIGFFIGAIRIDRRFKLIKEQIKQDNSFDRFISEIKSLAKELTADAQEIKKEEISKIRSKTILKSNWVELLAEEIIMKYLTNRVDLHTGNIGLTHYGEFRFFDAAWYRHSF